MRHLFAPSFLLVLFVGVGVYNYTATDQVLAFYGTDRLAATPEGQSGLTLGILAVLFGLSGLRAVWALRSERLLRGGGEAAGE